MNTSKLSVLCEVVTLLTCIQKSHGLNSGQGTDYPDWLRNFLWFSSLPSGKSWENILNYTITASIHICSNHYSLSSNHLMQLSLIYCH
jgi:hypothetical protein